ncbi:MAG: hypothetical protein IJP70_04805 [Bacteroidales bacterium]|nr:hypothetical protein [Bacteroidales bacterium]
MTINNDITGLGDASMKGKRVFVIYPDGKSSRLFHLPLGEGTDYFDCEVSCDANEKHITLTSEKSAQWVFIVKGEQTTRLAAKGKSVKLKY